MGPPLRTVSAEGPKGGNLSWSHRHLVAPPWLQDRAAALARGSGLPQWPGPRMSASTRTLGEWPRFWFTNLSLSLSPEPIFGKGWPWGPVGAGGSPGQPPPQSLHPRVAPPSVTWARFRIRGLNPSLASKDRGRVILEIPMDGLTFDCKSDPTNCKRRAGFQHIYSDHVPAVSARGH